MKKIYLYIIVGVLAIAGCAKTPSPQEPIVPKDEPSVIAPENEAKTVTIKASIEGETKTSYTEDTGTMKAIVGWEDGDKINVVYSSGGYSQYTFETTGDGSFTGTPSGTEGGKWAYVAVYPYNICESVWNVDGESREQIQISLPNSVTGSGADIIPMAVHMLKSEIVGDFDGIYHFKHLGSVLRFKFSNIPSTARHLIISSADHELAGRHYVSYNSTERIFYYTTGTTADGEQKEFTYNFTPNGDGTYTFFLPFGCTAPYGDFTFTFKDSDNQAICTRTTTLGALAGTTLVRNTMYRINIDALSFPDYPASLLNLITITPSTSGLASSSFNGTSPGNKFTISEIDFYALNARGTSGKTDNEYNNTGDAKIYNSTSLGRIVRIVVNKGANTYYRSAFKLFGGTSSMPTTNEIDYSSYVDEGGKNQSTTYVLGNKDYSHFTLLSTDSVYYTYTGVIQIYYLPAE